MGASEADRQTAPWRERLRVIIFEADTPAGKAFDVSLLPAMYLPVMLDHVRGYRIGRMDDIWASYYVQARGNKVVYGKPSVYQDRNEHDLVRDMKQEYPGYENNLNIVKDLAVAPERIRNYLPEQSIRAFNLYRKHFENA